MMIAYLRSIVWAPAADFVRAHQWVSISQKTYFPLVLSIKLCILLGYLRIFKIDRYTRWAIWFGMFACTVFYVVSFCVTAFRCKPVAAAWVPAIPGECLDYDTFPLATGYFNFLTDFYILLVPLPAIFRLKLPLVRRLRIASIFGLGVLYV